MSALETTAKLSQSLAAWENLDRHLDNCRLNAKNLLQHMRSIQTMDQNFAEYIEQMTLESLRDSDAIRHHCKALKQLINIMKQQGPMELQSYTQKFDELLQMDRDFEKYDYKKSRDYKSLLEIIVINDELEVDQTQTYIDTKCPLTSLEMQKPVKNIMCGHFYEESAILAHIKVSARNAVAAKCPRAGCPSNVTIDSLEEGTEILHEQRRRHLREGMQISKDADSENSLEIF